MRKCTKNPKTRSLWTIFRFDQIFNFELSFHSSTKFKHRPSPLKIVINTLLTNLKNIHVDFVKRIKSYNKSECTILICNK